MASKKKYSKDVTQTVPKPKLTHSPEGASGDDYTAAAKAIVPPTPSTSKLDVAKANLAQVGSADAKKQAYWNGVIAALEGEAP